MTDTKFTPGPLRADQHRVYNGKDKIASAWFVPEDLYGLTEDQRIAAVNEAFANAHLIAAAPELYEALEAMRDEIGRMKPTPSLVAVTLTANAALAKARGEA